MYVCICVFKFFLANKKKKATKLFRRKHKHTNRSVDSSSDTLSNLSCDYPDTNEATVNEYVRMFFSFFKYF